MVREQTRPFEQLKELLSILSEEELLRLHRRSQIRGNPAVSRLLKTELAERGQKPPEMI